MAVAGRKRGDADGRKTQRPPRKLIGITFFLLAAYIASESTLSLINGERPETSTVGIVLTARSILVMTVVALRKRVVAVAMERREAFEGKNDD